MFHLLHQHDNRPLTARLRFGGSPSAARGRLGQVGRARARATPSVLGDASSSHVALAGARPGCQTPEAPARERPRRDHLPAASLPVRVAPSLGGARVQGGAPGLRRTNQGNTTRPGGVR